MSGKLSIAPRSAPSCRAPQPVLPAKGLRHRQAQGDRLDGFKGLMALLAGCELALVDLGRGLSMHSGAGKDYNMEKAKAALETALRDFKRGNGL